MKKSILNNKYYLYGLLLLLIIWELLALFVGKETSILPGPLITFKHTFKLLKDNYTYYAIIQTLSRMLLGFIISFVLAFIIGILAGYYSFIYEILKPTIITLKSLPTACLVYTFIILVGSRNTPLYIVILVAFPILYESFVRGIINIDQTILDALKVDGTSFINEIIKIRLPLALPYISSGIASSLSLSFKIEIMAEVITGYTRLGLGSLILASQRTDPTNMINVFSYGFIAVILMLLLDYLLSHLKKLFN